MPKSDGTATSRTKRKVESKVSPVFGYETEELLALRALAKEVKRWFSGRTGSEGMEKSLEVVIQIQKKNAVH